MDQYQRSIDFLLEVQTYHLHVKFGLSVKAPPMSGAMTEEMPNMLDKIPIYNARFLKGTENPIIMVPPENIAAPPKPATARPMISATEL